MTEKIRLTFAEYTKASAAGMSGPVGWCGCVGPQNGNKYCPCSMTILNLIIPEEQYLMEEMWVEEDRIYREELKKKRAEEKEDVRPVSAGVPGSFNKLAEFEKQLD
jgi:hypothetical protein